jgi:hypothetical protein
MTISDIQEIMENSQMKLHVIQKKRHTRTASRSGSGIGSGASMQEGSTLKVIRLTQLQACPKKKCKKLVPKYF